MRQAASNLASKEMLRGVVQNGRFLIDRRVEQKVISERKEGIILGKVTHPYVERKGTLSCRLPILFLGDEESSCDRVPHWC